MPFTKLTEAVLEEFAEATAYEDTSRFTRGAGDDFDGDEGDALSAIGYRDTERSLGDEWLKAHGEKTFQDRGDKLQVAIRLAHHYQQKQQSRLEYIQAYHRTEAGIAARKRAYAKLKAKREAARMATILATREYNKLWMRAKRGTTMAGRQARDFTSTILRGGSIVKCKDGKVRVGRVMYPAWRIQCRCGGTFVRSSRALYVSVTGNSETVCDRCAHLVASERVKRTNARRAA